MSDPSHDSIRRPADGLPVPRCQRRPHRRANPPLNSADGTLLYAVTQSGRCLVVRNPWPRRQVSTKVKAVCPQQRRPAQHPRNREANLAGCLLGSPACANPPVATSQPPERRSMTSAPSPPCLCHVGRKTSGSREARRSGRITLTEESARACSPVCGAATVGPLIKIGAAAGPMGSPGRKPPTGPGEVS